MKHKILVLAIVAAMLGCGPKADPTNADNPPPGGDGDGTTAEVQKSALQTLVERLNAAIAEGNQAEGMAIIESQTVELLVEAAGLVPELTPVGEEFTLVDWMDWEKANGVVFSLENEAADGMSATMVAKVDDLDEFEGTIDLMGEGEGAQLEFVDMAAEIRDEVMSMGIQRQKFMDVVEALNKSIADGDTKAFQGTITNETLNQEVKLVSFSTAKKSNWNVTYLVGKMKKDGYLFSATGLDIESGDATVIVKDKDGNEVRKGAMKFVTEIGKLRLDYAAFLQTLIDAEQSKIDEKKTKKTK